MKKSKFKDYIKKFKELWAIPRYRAIIKLSLYAIMFIIIISMANIYQDTSSNKNNETEQTKTYTEIINSINLENCDIVYKIKTTTNEYKIEGKINNNILTGYLENNNVIKKIKVSDNTIYQLNNDSEILDSSLNLELMVSFLIPTNIINLVNDESAYIEKSETNTAYTFNITTNNINYEIKLTTNLETLTNITIINDQIEYNMELNFDKTV